VLLFAAAFSHTAQQMKQKAAGNDPCGTLEFLFQRPEISPCIIPKYLAERLAPAGKNVSKFSPDPTKNRFSSSKNIRRRNNHLACYPHLFFSRNT
jgi:hypothetical protein